MVDIRDGSKLTIPTTGGVKEDTSSSEASDDQDQDDDSHGSSGDNNSVSEVPPGHLSDLEYHDQGDMLIGDEAETSHSHSNYNGDEQSPESSSDESSEPSSHDDSHTTHHGLLNQTQNALMSLSLAQHQTVALSPLVTMPPPKKSSLNASPLHHGTSSGTRGGQPRGGLMPSPLVQNQTLRVSPLATMPPRRSPFLMSLNSPGNAGVPPKVGITTTTTAPSRFPATRGRVLRFDNDSDDGVDGGHSNVAHHGGNQPVNDIGEYEGPSGADDYQAQSDADDAGSTVNDSMPENDKNEDNSEEEVVVPKKPKGRRRKWGLSSSYDKNRNEKRRRLSKDKTE